MSDRKRKKGRVQKIMEFHGRSEEYSFKLGGQSRPHSENDIWVKTWNEVTV